MLKNILTTLTSKNYYSIMPHKMAIQTLSKRYIKKIHPEAKIGNCKSYWSWAPLSGVVLATIKLKGEYHDIHMNCIAGRINSHFSEVIKDSNYGKQIFNGDDLILQSA